jgi:hypothetical protein
MPGKLPIDRVRATEQAAHPYQGEKRAFNERQAEQRANQPPVEVADEMREIIATRCCSV